VNALMLHNPEFDLPMQVDGDTFRVHAPSLARYLGHHDAIALIRHLPDNEKMQVKGYVLERTPSDQGVWWVTEAGFYRAVGQRQPARI
jgi:anti-repressor protein